MQCFSPQAGAVLLVAALTAPAWAADTTQRYEADAASASQITVEGTSTVHEWKAVGNVIRGHVILDAVNPLSLGSAKAEIEIPAESLKSGKNAMDKKMYESLKIQTHPMITYHLETAQTNGSDSIQTVGILTVAGKSRRIEIPMQLKRLANGTMEISGETVLRMTDFGINPPRAMMGVLRTGNEVHVHWRSRFLPRHSR